MQEIKEGNQAADSAAASIEIVVDGIGKIAESSRSISEISKDQANAMDQAEQGVNQISEVSTVQLRYRRRIFRYQPGIVCTGNLSG